ncbi:semaphorin-7A-like isoform X2 [Clupea harengus]|uniref:Semaphorin-7A-like isoform X2 n=1 Tax=Clupea harengus TaxID=7950 RepID=A0A8M1KNF4_CLUHA|nr:semaphorin-7A-like isoform X2 [Clupea harengus]
MANVGLFLLVLLIITPQAMAESYHKARLKLTEREITFQRGLLVEQMDKHLTTMKLILGSKDEIYAGGGRHLFHLNFQKNQGQTMVQRIPIPCDTVKTDCGITVMQPGRDGYPLFVCTAGRQIPKGTCCDKDVNGSTNCTSIYGGGEPALLTGEILYTTQSGVRDKDGIYRKRLYNVKDQMKPPSSRSDQQYVKIIERKLVKVNTEKLYAFYTEKNHDKDPDSDIFTPRVSQVCMADLGGSKDTLQFQWTSQLSSRLSCGDPSRKLYYTELLDVAVLPSEDGADARVYGLFRNGWEMRAVCVYAMNDIDGVFNNSSPKPTKTLSRRPGECVQDSRNLPSDLLKYMKSDPEMMNWVGPIGHSNPLLVSRCNYSHIQVDRVGGTEGQEGHNVLLLSTESGAVHKVLENSSDPFIIAEYHPFKPGTHILSMLLDSSQKKLYVSSNAEVVQIDLRNCSVYGDQCADCILARDPYCGWDRNQKRCSTYSEGKNVLSQSLHDCTPEQQSAALKSSPEVNPDTTQFVSESSRHFLPCPVHSQHAEYRWMQGGEERQSIMDSEQEQLVLLIDGMRSADEGLYQCESKEGDYRKTVVQYQLRMSSAVGGLKSSPLALALLLLLLFTLLC